VVGTFYREGSYDGGAQSLRDFYAEYERMIGGERSLSRYAKTDRTSAQAFVREAQGERWAQRAPQLKAAKQQLEDLGDVINAIYAAPASAATPEQKRQALDRAYERMVDVARAGLGKAPRHGTTPVTAGRAAVGQTPITVR
jgi:hypothetical protein